MLGNRVWATLYVTLAMFIKLEVNSKPVREQWRMPLLLAQCNMKKMSSNIMDLTVYKNRLQHKWKHNTHSHPFNGPFPGLPGWAGTRKVKPIGILLKQETVSGSGINWVICKPAPHHSVFYRPDALPATQPTASKHWMETQQWKK